MMPQHAEKGMAAAPFGTAAIENYLTESESYFFAFLRFLVFFAFGAAFLAFLAFLRAGM
jgi:hypothetical protein